MFSRRTLNAYTVLLAGAILFLLRRLVLPTVFETEGVPFNIALPSAMYACSQIPSLSNCSDGVLGVLTIVGVALAAGWGSLGRMVFSLILMLLPLSMFLMLSPIWIPIVMVILLPLALDVGVRLFEPA
jgi:hypothetical protein